MADEHEPIILVTIQKKEKKKEDLSLLLKLLHHNLPAK